MDDPSQTTLFPCDLESATQEGPFRLAGRVVRVETGSGGAPHVWLADAFAVVRLRGSPDVEVGDLVVLSVRRDHGDPEALDLVERHRPASGSRVEQARFIDGGVGSNLLARSRALGAVRSFFAERDFVEVDTPQLVTSPGLDLHLDAVEVAGTEPGRPLTPSPPAYLITSPEYQMKRLLVAGVPRLFQLSHVFRRGEIGARHNPEFAMLEWYRAFAPVDDVMRDTEELVKKLFATLRSEATQSLPSIAAGDPFGRLTLQDAFARYASISEADFFAMAARDEDKFFRILVEHVEPALASLPAPVFLHEYPVQQASLARAKPSDPRVCERFELYVGGIELCNGFGELTDPTEQRRRLLADQAARHALGKPVYPIDERFLAALEEGMPPSAGNALGLDRLIALALGERDIAQVMPFPIGVL